MRAEPYVAREVIFEKQEVFRPRAGLSHVEKVEMQDFSWLGSMYCLAEWTRNTIAPDGGETVQTIIT